MAGPWAPAWAALLLATFLGPGAAAALAGALPGDAGPGDASPGDAGPAASALDVPARDPGDPPGSAPLHLGAPAAEGAEVPDPDPDPGTDPVDPLGPTPVPALPRPGPLPGPPLGPLLPPAVMEALDDAASLAGVGPGAPPPAEPTPEGTHGHVASGDFDEPGRPGEPPGGPGDLIGAAVAAGGVLALGAGAAALLWPALKGAMAPLYSRISRDAVLLHGSREAIYKLVKENPGIHAHEVAERLDLAWGTAIHHLKLLEQSGLLTAHRDGRYKRFFVVGDHRIGHKEAVGLLRNDTARRIAEVVAGRPGLIQKDVCEALGVSSSLATWHLQRLADAGVVLAHRRGRVVHYEPGPAWGALRDMPPAA